MFPIKRPQKETETNNVKYAKVLIIIKGQGQDLDAGLQILVPVLSTCLMVMSYLTQRSSPD